MHPHALFHSSYLMQLREIIPAFVAWGFILKVLGASGRPILTVYKHKFLQQPQLADSRLEVSESGDSPAHHGCSSGWGSGRGGGLCPS